jgi:hypothetical protein
MSKVIGPPGDSAESVAANLHKMGAAGAKLAERALYRAGHRLRRTVIPVTPLRDGALRRSFYVAPPRRKGGEVTIEVGFDGKSAPYALWVHEMPTSTNWSEPGTGPKFLEGPFDEMSRTLAKDLANDIARMMRRNRVLPVDE